MKKIAMFGMLAALFAATGCSHEKNEECNADTFVMHCEDQDVVTCVQKPQSTRPGAVEKVTQYVVNDVIYACDADGNITIANRCDPEEGLSVGDEFVDHACGFYGDVYCVDGVAVENVNSQYCAEDEDVQDYPRLSDYASCDGDVLMIATSGDGLAAANGNYVCDPDSGQVISCKAGHLVKASSVCTDGGVLTCEVSGSYALRVTACGDSETCVDYERGGSKVAACFRTDAVGSDCGSTTTFGSCSDDDSLVMCSNDNGTGKLLRISCSVEGQQQGVSKKCGLVEDSYGYDCQITCEDGEGHEYTDFGTCDGVNLSYCRQDGTLDLVTCGTSCSWQGDYYDCD